MLYDAIRKSKGEDVVEEENNGTNDKPLINVSTHIDDNYVMDMELKIIIHKRINEVDSYDSFCKVKEELEDRFGKLPEDMVIYMYEEWFEKLAKLLDITCVIDDKKQVDIKLPANISEKNDGEQLFMETYQISKNFRLSYKDSCIHVILDKSNNEQHYLMYLIGLLIKIKSMVKK